MTLALRSAQRARVQWTVGIKRSRPKFAMVFSVVITLDSRKSIRWIQVKRRTCYSDFEVVALSAAFV